MKFFVREEDRKPDPAPIQTSVSKVALVGLVIWVLTLIVLLVFPTILPTPVKPWWPYTCLVAIVFGVVLYVKFRRSK